MSDIIFLGSLTNQKHLDQTLKVTMNTCIKHIWVVCSPSTGIHRRHDKSAHQAIITIHTGNNFLWQHQILLYNWLVFMLCRRILIKGALVSGEGIDHFTLIKCKITSQLWFSFLFCLFSSLLLLLLLLLLLIIQARAPPTLSPPFHLDISSYSVRCIIGSLYFPAHDFTSLQLLQDTISVFILCSIHFT